MVTGRKAILATTFGLVALFAAAHPVLDPDMWWHLSVGEAIWQKGSLYFVDPLSFTNLKVWVNSQWLSEAIFAMLNKMAGIGGLEVTALFLKVAVFLLVFASMSAEPLRKLWLTILFAFGALPVMGGLRPQLFSFLFIALLSLTIHKQRQSANANSEIQSNNFCGLPIFVSLPMLFALWANLHSFYPIAFFLLVIAIFADWVNEKKGMKPVMGLAWRKQMAFALFFCIFAVMLTPFGWNSAKQVIVNIVQSSQLPIEEWKPAPQMSHPLVLIWAFLLLLWFFCLAWSPKRPDALELFWGAFVTLNALTGVRMIALWCMLIAPFVCEHINQWFSKSERLKAKTEAPNWMPALTVVLLALLSIFILSVRFSPEEFTKRERKEYPRGAVVCAMERGLKGNCLTSYDWGGYVAWQTKGNLKVFVDGRADFYPLKVMRDFIALYYGKSKWKQILNRYKVDIAIVSPDAPVASLLALSDDWQLIYRDKVAVIFLRRASLAFHQFQQGKLRREN